MSWSVGIDLAEPARLRQRMDAHPHLVDELFTPGEQAYCTSQWDPAQHFAGRFCAKEAVIKALGADGWDPLEVEIEDGDPAPQVRLHGDLEVCARDRGVALHVSITHLPSMAAAVAIAVPAAPGP